LVVIGSRDLLHARLKASLAGADRGLEFASGHQLDPVSANQIRANMIGRFLDDSDLRKLHQMLIRKKPPAPSVRRRTATRQSVTRRKRAQSQGQIFRKENAAPGSLALEGDPKAALEKPQARLL
jgi:hypothetical protein